MSNFPSCYQPERIGTLFHPDYAAIAAEAAHSNLRPASEDEQKVHLLLIDMQVDFCHPNGSLFVPGALEDVRRIVEFIYQHAERISQISCSLDSHLPYQIFHPTWWADEAGNHPAPFTLISAADIDAGRWRPLVAAEQSIAYVKKLEGAAKKVLTIWPYHVMIGSMGNALDPALFTAVLWHSLARKTQPNWLNKGTIPLTEHYSIIQPEVPAPNHPMGSKNSELLDNLAQADVILVAGEAESHCVLETVEDMVEDFATRPNGLQKLYLLQDCMSPVLHPKIDFHAIAQARFTDFKQQGVRFINSTDSLPF